MVWMVVAVALAGCSESIDRDGDGMHNAEETTPWTVTITLLDRRIQYDVVSDPDLADSDGDGLGDLVEFHAGTDPGKADTDEDGLTDCQELRHRGPVCETPGDGGYGTSPTRADSDLGKSRYRAKLPFDGEVPDGDGIPDGVEVKGFRVNVAGSPMTVRTDPLQKDSDGDLLEDAEEVYIYKTDPTAMDTDGDGCQDGLDVVPTVDERLRIDFEAFVWHAEPATIVVHTRIADAEATSEPFVVEPGPVDLRQHSLPSVRPRACTYETMHPWVPVDVWIQFPDGTRADTSGDVPGPLARLWWNVPDELHASSRDGPPRPATGEHWMGADAEVTFRPVWAPAE